MKNISKLILSLLLIVIGIVFICQNFYDEKNVVESINNNTNHMLAMYLETSYGSGEYVLAKVSKWPSGYIFNEKLSKCENGTNIIWDDENKEIILNTTITDKCNIYFDKPMTFADYIKSLYASNSDNTNGLYYHDGSITTTSLGIDSNNTVLDAEDASYRYAGSNDVVKNYVCFGYDDPAHNYGVNWCPEENLYRIIGVFGNKVKLIKADLAGTNLLGDDYEYDDYNYSSAAANEYTAYTGTLTIVPRYYWSRYNSGYTDTPNYDTVGSSYKDTAKYNVWSYSYLNQKNLNTNYLNNIGTKWAGMITKTTWNNNDSVVTNAKNAYNADMAAATNPYNPVDAKVGLMYVNEYAYGADPSNWATSLGNGGYNNAKVTSENWLYNGVPEWTISRRPWAGYLVYWVYSTGYVVALSEIYSYAYGVRPVFNLSSSVTYDGGTGAVSDPYLLKLD